MGLLDDCKQYFGTDDLYEVLGVKNNSKDNEIKSAYRKQSLKVHPDRAEDDNKESAKRAFQTLSKVHFILSDKSLRETYDETGIIPNEDSFESKADWSEYWRLLFPKITVKDIDTFLKKYIGSEDEKNDLKTYYNRFGGDMELISQCMIGFDETRTRDLIQQMIDDKEVEEFEKFTEEPEGKREKRAKRAAKEAKMAEKEAKKVKDSNDDLVLAIKNKNKSGFDDLIANLEAKYANTQNTHNKTKNKSKTSKRK